MKKGVMSRFLSRDNYKSQCPNKQTTEFPTQKFLQSSPHPPLASMLPRSYPGLCVQEGWPVWLPGYPGSCWLCLTRGRRPDGRRWERSGVFLAHTVASPALTPECGGVPPPCSPWLGSRGHSWPWTPVTGFLALAPLLTASVNGFLPLLDLSVTPLHSHLKRPLVESKFYSLKAFWVC